MNLLLKIENVGSIFYEETESDVDNGINNCSNSIEDDSNVICKYQTHFRELKLPFILEKRNI